MIDTDKSSLLLSPAASTPRQLKASLVYRWRRLQKKLWHNKFGLLWLWLLYEVLTRTALALAELSKLSEEGTDTWREQTSAIGLAFVLLTLPIAMFLVGDHLLNFVEPKRQRQTVG